MDLTLGGRRACFAYWLIVAAVQLQGAFALRSAGAALAPRPVCAPLPRTRPGRAPAHAAAAVRALRGGVSMSASPLVSCEWLKDNLDKVKVLDASWYLSSMERAPGVKFDAVGEFEKQRIPGAAFFDIDKICDCESPHPHMMPSAEFFAQCVASLGVQRDDHVVVYDGKGIFSAPRAWTMFQLFGHPKVQILDGGMPAWLDAGFDVETSPQSAAALDSAVETYGDAAGPSSVLSMEDVKANIASGQYQLVDARPFARFTGEAPEPRPIESGHIEGSYCVPFLDVLTSQGQMKGDAEITELLVKQKVDISKPIAVAFLRALFRMFRACSDCCNLRVRLGMRAKDCDRLTSRHPPPNAGHLWEWRERLRGACGTRQDWCDGCAPLRWGLHRMEGF